MICLMESEWTKVQVAADGIAAIGIVFTLFYSLWSFTRTLRDSYYAELDRIYFELLKIALERPYLMDFARAPDPSKQGEYDVYAFMVWNFVESIFDRCRGRGRTHLRATWYPIVAAENELHRQWFDQNRTRFKKVFCEFMEREYPKK